MRKLYPLVITDAGRNLSRRINSNLDCTVRALSIVTDASFDDCYDLLAKSGRKPHQGFDIDGWLSRRRLPIFGGRFKRISVTRRSEVCRADLVLTPTTFPIWHPIGYYLVTTINHVYALKNGTSYDLRRVKDQPLESAWLWTPLPKTP